MQVIHYDGDGDEPGWIVEDATQPEEVTRWVEGADGQVAVQTGKTGERVLQLVDLHGDVVATVPIGDGAVLPSQRDLRFVSYDEFGNPQPLSGGATSNAPPRYGWLGAAQRSSDTPAGVVLMRVRLYHPGIGRFLQVDPVAGGSANAYDYCNADPVNCTDLGGTIAWGKILGAVAAVGSVASFIPGPIGAAAGAISAVAYGLSGNTKMVVMMGAVAAAQLVGAGPAARVGASMAARAGSAASRAASQVARVTRATNDAAKRKVSEALIRRCGGANRVTVQQKFGRLIVDLKGRVHHENGVRIPPPHWKFQGYNHHFRNAIPGKFANAKNAIVRPASWSIIWKAFKVIRKR
ncbi:RHS repeat domain-containing protein [Cellulomonas flavigena]|uniref:RHS repeat domain-containing protein n=1 Tax=Cellulomonas flavigena TaxID=1711 RepID=UPI0005B90A5D|nr:RHS repeat-associated core domain-containing protein [Cellulomonas flavigena]